MSGAAVDAAGVERSANPSGSWQAAFTRADIASFPELQPLYDRYLSQASFVQDERGLVLKVPTSFHVKTLMGCRQTLELVHRRPIVSIEVQPRDSSSAAQNPPHSRPAAPVSQQQVALSLPPRVPTTTPIEEERKRRITPPTLIRSPVFEMPVQLVQRWGYSLNQGARSQALWIHGSSGSGKTWLLRQLHEWVGLHLKIVTVDVVSFFHEWRRALESKDTLAFTKKYRKEVDLLILENIDDLQGKTGTQQEVLYTVNALLDRGAAIAVSSTLHPMQVKDLLEPALFSRLFSGLALDMPEPDRPFKERLWRHLIDNYGLKEYPLDLMLQERLFSMNVDTARKAYTLFINAIGRLSHKQALSPLDLAELEGSYGTAAGFAGPAHNPLEMIEKVARLCGVGASAIQGKVRRQDVSLARRFVCLSLSRFLGLTNAAIAAYVEKDPSTVCYALKTLEEDIEKDRHIAQQWNWICSQLGMRPQ